MASSLAGLTSTLAGMPSGGDAAQEDEMLGLISMNRFVGLDLDDD